MSNRRELRRKNRICQEESPNPMNEKLPLWTNASSTSLVRASCISCGINSQKEGSTVPSDFPQLSFPSTRIQMFSRMADLLWGTGMTLKSWETGCGLLYPLHKAECSKGLPENNTPVLILPKQLLIRLAHSYIMCISGRQAFLNPKTLLTAYSVI